MIATRFQTRNSIGQAYSAAHEFHSIFLTMKPWESVISLRLMLTSAEKLPVTVLSHNNVVDIAATQPRCFSAGGIPPRAAKKTDPRQERGELRDF